MQDINVFYTGSVTRWAYWLSTPQFRYVLCSPVCCCEGYVDRALSFVAYFLQLIISESNIITRTCHWMHRWSAVKNVQNGWPKGAFSHQHIFRRVTFGLHWENLQTGKVVGWWIIGVRENNNTESGFQYYTPSLRFSSLRYFGVGLLSLGFDRKRNFDVRS